MENVNLMKDHDILTTLVADVKNLKEAQDSFHIEMRVAMKDLQANYSATLASHETRIQNLEITRTDFREKISNTTFWVKTLCAIGLVLIGLMSWHIIGYKL